MGNIFSLPTTLLVAFIVIVFLIALMPGIVEVIDQSQRSDSLNCSGYKEGGDASDPLSYNSSLGQKSSIGCLAIKLYIPIIILGVLVGILGMIFYGRTSGGQDQMY